MNLRIGFSPCPNDTFMFNALINGKLNTHGIHFIPVIEDVEALNKMALRGELDITKLSLNAFAFAASYYQVLNSGSALGYNCGPLLVSKNKYTIADISKLRIAIPGRYTTANLLLTVFFNDAVHKTEMVFSDIENAVLSNAADAGLLIHENRFTYAERGLQKIADLGEMWHSKTGMPLPLGCIAVKKDIPLEIKTLADQLISESVKYAFNNTEETMPFVKQHAQEMDELVMKQHIDLYVTKASVSMGAEGEEAISYLLAEGNRLRILPPVENIFLSKETTIINN